MTKEEKIARYSKLNQEVVPGKIAMANKAVQELAERALEIFRFFRDAARSVSVSRHGQPSCPSSEALSWLSAISR